MNQIVEALNLILKDYVKGQLFVLSFKVVTFCACIIALINVLWPVPGILLGEVIVANLLKTYFTGAILAGALWCITPQSWW